MIKSFNNIRVVSNNAGGNVGAPKPVGTFADGDALNLFLTNDLPTDTLDVVYGINGGPTTNLATYTGAGNFYTNFTDARMFKFGDNDGPATAALDSYYIVVPQFIPEPSSLMLAAFGLLSIARLDRRRPRRV